MTTSVAPIAVTGSTGQLGGRVATRLATLGHLQRLLVRNPSRAPQLPGAEIMQASYEDGPSMRVALSEIQVLFLVSGYGPTRLEQHYIAIDAARAAGVERIVYTSFLSAAPLATFTHAREHYLIEQRIRESGCRYTFLRPTFYLDRAPRWFSDEGVVKGPASNGTITWVSRDDLADVAVAVLTSNGRDGASYEITGAQAFTLKEAAEEFSSATGIPTRYQPETIEEARASRAKFNPTDWELEAWVSTYVAIARRSFNGYIHVYSLSIFNLLSKIPLTYRSFCAVVLSPTIEFIICILILIQSLNPLGLLYSFVVGKCPPK